MSNLSANPPANPSYNPPSNHSPNRFLKQVLTVDSAVSLAGGALHVAFSGALQGLTGINSTVYLATGLFLLVFGVLVGLLAWLEQPPSALIWFLIIGNLGWALASAALLVQPISSYTAVGVSYLGFNALWVVLMAFLEYLGLQKRHAGRVA